MSLFNGKHILLGVTGSIACYKAADLASKLTQAGALVDVILTGSAQQFIMPLTFESVTGRRAYTDADLWGGEGHVLHIGLARQADLVVIAPASANTLAKLAHGIADNLLTVTALAAECPLILAPAMDGHMYANLATQDNVELHQQRGALIAGPASGRMASGIVGVGRLLEPAELVGHIRLALARGGPLTGFDVLITAGGTEEPIDPVRSITNRSSGKQGFALAQAALDLGAHVTLVAGPTHLAAPVGVHRVDVRTAQQMMDEVLKHIPQADALLMAAAVADFRPASAAQQKIKKDMGLPVLHLDTNPDILGAVGRIRAEKGYPDVLVGFAAESQELLANARQKLEAKNLDLIAANDITARDAGFEVDTNRITLLDASGGMQTLPLMSKEQVAEVILERVVSLLQTKEILHICKRSDLELARARGEYRSPSLETEGFIHFSRSDQLLSVANRYYHGQADLVVLWVRPRSLRAELRWERATVPDSGKPEQDMVDEFPHLYGPLNLDAIVAVRNLEADQDGYFRKLLLPRK
jgi:phosphopantothenoylcysteine decarboxylase/phosphopantothenate--cysteine ligase